MAARKLGISALTVLDAPPPDAVVAAAEAGFDAVGLRVFPAGDEPAWPLIGDTPMVRETLRRLDDTGIAPWDVEVLRIRPDKEISEHLSILDAGTRLGARYVLVNVNDPDPGRRLERLNVVAAAAGERGLTLAVEYMVFTEIRTLGDALDLVELIEGPAVVLPDSLHAARSGGTAAELSRVPAEQIAYAQLCDAITSPEPTSPEEALTEARTGRRFPGDGDLALAEFTRALPAGTPLSVEAPVRDVPLAKRCVNARASLIRVLAEACEG